MPPCLTGRDLQGRARGRRVKDSSKTSIDPCFYPEAANLRTEKRKKKGKKKNRYRRLRTEKDKLHFCQLRSENQSKAWAPQSWQEAEKQGEEPKLWSPDSRGVSKTGDRHMTLLPKGRPPKGAIPGCDNPTSARRTAARVGFPCLHNHCLRNCHR